MKKPRKILILTSCIAGSLAIVGGVTYGLWCPEYALTPEMSWSDLFSDLNYKETAGKIEHLTLVATTTPDSRYPQLIVKIKSLPTERIIKAGNFPFGGTLSKDEIPFQESMRRYAEPRILFMAVQNGVDFTCKVLHPTIIPGQFSTQVYEFVKDGKPTANYHPGNKGVRGPSKE